MQNVEKQQAAIRGAVLDDRGVRRKVFKGREEVVDIDWRKPG